MALTLPDLLRSGLDIVFVGINPGLASAQVGRYFAHPRNRFWPATNAAGIFSPPLSPETAHLAPTQGVGFTDVVKRASASASNITSAEFRAGAPVLKEKLLRAAPKVVCFNGLTAAQNFARYAEGGKDKLAPGRQEWRIGSSAVFVVPSPSPANAGVSLDELTGWYAKAASLRRELTTGASSRRSGR